MSATAGRSARIDEHRGQSCRRKARHLPASWFALLDRDAGDRDAEFLARERPLRGASPRLGEDSAASGAQSGGSPLGPCFAQGRAAQQWSAPAAFLPEAPRRRRGRSGFRHRGPPRPRRRRSVPPGHVSAGAACVTDASLCLAPFAPGADPCGATARRGPIMLTSGQGSSAATRFRRDQTARRADSPTVSAGFAPARSRCRERHPRDPCSSAT